MDRSLMRKIGAESLSVVASSSARVAYTLTALIVVLAAVAAAGGLFIRGLYREPAEFVPVLQGQDLVTLIASPVLAVSLLAAVRGSARARIVWIGLLGYMLYTYIGASLGYRFNQFFLLYVALFSLTIFTLVTAVSCTDVAGLHRRFDASAPRKPVAVFLVMIAVMLAVIELGENIRFLTTGAIPKTITDSGGITNFVYVLDLGIIVPLALLSVTFLWRRAPWGYLLAGVILVKGATMGLALLSMELFSVLAGRGTDGLEILWAVIAFGSLGMAIWLLRHCRG